MSPNDVASLLLRLSDRDLAVLESLRAHRLLGTAQIRRLHFAEGHATVTAASGATMRVLVRLESHGLVARLTRRIGGVRSGSSGIVWQLASTGERLLRTVHGEKKRRRYVEPSLAFTAHTLAVAELAVRLHEFAGAGTIELLSVETEPSCWRSFVNPHGTVEWLKPDLYAVTASGDYEDHWLLEADRATEHPTVVVRKAKTYQRYAATGAHQARHGLFPAVAWVLSRIRPDVAPWRPPCRPTRGYSRSSSGSSPSTSSGSSSLATTWSRQQAQLLHLVRSTHQKPERQISALSQRKNRELGGVTPPP